MTEQNQDQQNSVFVKEVLINDFINKSEIKTIEFNNNVSYIIGHNGSGKTALINAIATLLKNYSLLKEGRFSTLQCVFDNGAKSVIRKNGDDVFVDFKEVTPDLIYYAPLEPFFVFPGEVDLQRMIARVMINSDLSRLFVEQINYLFGDDDKRFYFDDMITIKQRCEKTNYAVYFENFSNSIKYVIHLLLSACLANNRTVVLMDMPETHLHIHVREHLIPCMRRINPSLQFIVATHCPSIVMDRSDSFISL